MSLQPQGFGNVPCSSFLTGCFQLRSSSLYSFFQVVQPLKVLWFHSFVKKQLSFTSSFFRFSPVTSLDLGAGSLVSGGELSRSKTGAADAFL